MGQPISSGGNRLLVNSPTSITIWCINPLSSAPSLIIPAPHAHTFRSAALTSCGSFFAILISAESAHPAVVICSSLSGEILLRIELRDVRPSVKLPVTWVSTTGTHSLIVPTEENYLLALEFCDGYKRIESKRKLNVDYACGDIEKITPVICGKDGHALAFIYPHAIAVLSYPEGKALVVNRNVRTRAIIRVIQTSSKFVAIGIIETTSSYVRALPTDVVLSTDIVRQLTANPVKGPLSGLAWALIGNSRYSVLAPVPNVTAQGVVAYCNLPSSYCGLGMFSDTGRIMAFDPQKRASVLWEHQLPDDCMRNLRSAALYTATSDYSENSFIILAHPSSFQCRTTETQAVCVHIVGSPLDEPDQKTDTTEVLWPKTVLRPSSFNSEARLHSPAPLNMTPNSATDQIAQKQPSIPLFLRLKPINSREELIATDRADHASSAELLSNGSEAIAQPALIRKALENVTNLGVNRTISRNRRRFQKKKLCSSALAQAEQTVLGLQNHSSEDDNGA